MRSLAKVGRLPYGVVGGVKGREQVLSEAVFSWMLY